ncbi:MAG: MptD family putative ECF transporter S component [Treponema sp.]|uniref:MptD family putative ECF transporter S component n=1 Tax=Treponema sp. TaxID=166 RepID=UPI00298E54BF|nr:MptD family putative ECF transporter S component [Treponema sp.]MCQ2601808.1 MptD family putative ECF transporter S component [Treponema sp.]
MKTTNRLNGKDFVNIGIFTAIDFIIVTAAAMLGFIPIFMPLLCAIAPLVSGIPYMLYLTKVRKFGMIWIMNILLGLLMFLAGMSYHALIISVFTGLAADLVCKSGNYKSAAKGIISHGVFSIYIAGNFFLLTFMKDKYFATRQTLGSDYIEKLSSYTPVWVFPILILACFIFGIIGALIGKAMLKKHFAKAGIA